jgi:hypothetical protein
MRALLHFLSIGFATIEVEEKIAVQPHSEPGEPKAIRFRSEHFWSPKPALPDRLHFRDSCNIIIIFIYLQAMVGAGMRTLPPVALYNCKTVKFVPSIKPSGGVKNPD